MFRNKVDHSEEHHIKVNKMVKSENDESNQDTRRKAKEKPEKKKTQKRRLLSIGNCYNNVRNTTDTVEE